MINVDNDYVREARCEYKGETYWVRDNGAIFRVARKDKPRRPKDEKWTFGESVEKGYAKFCGESVHRIVAYAFLGEPKGGRNVVDHIDTNRQNNRPENLRWVSKLENILLNPTTKAKKEYICGSIENFLKDPSLLNGHEASDTNFAWMRAVTKEEAMNTLYNWQNLISIPRFKSSSENRIGEWIYESSNKDISGRFSFDALLSDTEDVSKVDVDKEIEGTDTTEIESQPYEKKEIEVQPVSKNELMKAILSISEQRKLNCQKYYKDDNVKADILITYNGKRFAITQFSSSKAAKRGIEQMRLNDIEAWGFSLSQISQPDVTIPYFYIDRVVGEIMVTIGKRMISLAQFIDCVLSDRIVFHKKTLITDIDVMFVPTKCYRCNTEHNVYIVNGIFDEFGVRHSPYNLDIPIDLHFDEKVRSVIRNYIKTNPQRNIVMGDIKYRYSKTVDMQYLSFGCPRCDAMVGNYYLDEIKMDYMYEEAPDKMIKLKLITPFKVYLPYWEIKRIKGSLFSFNSEIIESRDKSLTHDNAKNIQKNTNEQLDDI